MSVAKNQLPMASTAKTKPYPHQEAAISDAIIAFKKADRATIVMPYAK